MPWTGECSMRKNILLSLKRTGLLLGLLCTETLGAIAQEMSASEFREGYQPQQFNPFPEWTIFVDLGIVLLLMILGICFVSKSKKAKPVRILTWISLIYLGLIRGGCICPVGAITNVTVGMLNPAFTGLATVILFLLPIVMALVAGRIFCSAGCPLGAVQQLFYKRKKHYRLPEKVNTLLKIVPVLMLAATIFAALNYTFFLVCKLEPYKALFFTGGSWFRQLYGFIAGHSVEFKILWGCGIFAWIYLIAVLVLGYWVPRPFCRLLCPYGVILGAVSLVSFRKREIRKENCVYCGACQKACPVQAIRIDRSKQIASVSSYSCIQCNECSGTCKKDAIK